MPILGSPSGRTVRQLVDLTLHKLLGGQAEKRDKLAIALTDSAADVDVQLTYNTSSSGLARGSVLEVGRELLYVWSIAAGTPDTLTVERGYAGTEIGSHASGDVITENPTYHRDDAFDALLAEVQGLNGTGLYAFYVVDLTHSESSQVYALDDPDVGNPIGVYALDYDTSGMQDVVGKGKVRLLSNLPAATSANGFGIQLLEGGHQGQPMRAVVMSTFDDFAAESEVLGTVCGIPSYAEMALVWGAAEQMLLPAEARRNQLTREHGSRNPAEVQSTANAFTANQFRQRRQNALQAAILRQQSEFPMRRSA